MGLFIVAVTSKAIPTNPLIPTSKILYDLSQRLNAVSDIATTASRIHRP